MADIVSLCRLFDNDRLLNIIYKEDACRKMIIIISFETGNQLFENTLL